jgi:hypothetical protein
MTGFHQKANPGDWCCFGFWVSFLILLKKICDNPKHHALLIKKRRVVLVALEWHGMRQDCWANMMRNDTQRQTKWGLGTML